jgi:RNA polymerase sigma-70 factor (ECF subfamily)
MENRAREDLERAVRTHCDAHDQAAAATAALRGYGGELLGFLMAVHRDEAEAEEVFSLVTEAIWSGLPKFAWSSTLRTWAYAVARNVSRTYKRDTARRGRRLSPASESALQAVAEEVRTQTLSFLRTEKRSRLEGLRDSLAPDDRMLLVLRVDRKLAWRDLARILAADEAPTDDVALAREAARLRKRFQLVKERLRTQAKREGLIE